MGWNVAVYTNPQSIKVRYRLELTTHACTGRNATEELYLSMTSIGETQETTQGRRWVLTSIHTMGKTPSYALHPVSICRLLVFYAIASCKTTKAITGQK
jgi:hypothetical protein